MVATEIQIPLLPVLLGAAFEGESSPRGMTKLIRADKCGRLANLVDANPDFDKAGWGAQVGSVFHKLAELYFEDKLVQYILPTFDYEPEKGDPNAPVAEGLRLFNAFRKNFAKEMFGEVLECERLFGEDDFEKELLKQTFGFELTGRWDMRTRMNERACQLLRIATGVDLVPGVYLWDWKNSDRNDSNITLEYHNSLQFNSYTLAHNMFYPDEQCKGLIAVNLVRHVKIELGKSYTFVHVPTPHEFVAENIREWISGALESKTANKRRYSSCSGKYGPCGFLKAGLCGLNVPENL